MKTIAIVTGAAGVAYVTWLQIHVPHGFSISCWMKMIKKFVK